MAYEILRLPQVKQRTGLPVSTIYAYIAQDRFPKQIKLSERSVGWLADEIDAWVKQRIAESRGKTPTKSAT